MRPSKPILSIEHGHSRTPELMTIQEALVAGRKKLAVSPNPGLDARLLLEYVLQKGHTYLIAHANDILSSTQETVYFSLLEEAAGSMPIPYLTGIAPFYGCDFIVSPAVLIPRPETELLVEAALAWLDRRVSQKERLNIVDIGTGSGCIAISLARHFPSERIEATDISQAALDIARRNAQIHGVEERVSFQQGWLLEPVNGAIDLIIANLPYVADDEWTLLDDGVKWFEPELALKGGSDGLDLIRQLLNAAKIRLSSGGAIFLEIGWQQGSAVVELAHSIFPAAQAKVSPDLSGLDRLVEITDAN